MAVEKSSGDRQARFCPRCGAHAQELLCDLSKLGDSSKPSFPCLFSMDNRIRRRKKIVCVWRIASVQCMSVTTRAGFQGLNILQLPKATEALRICHSCPEILIYKRLLLAFWGIHILKLLVRGGRGYIIKDMPSIC